MIAIETAKDALVFIAIPATIFSGSLEVAVWGQAAASLITFVIALAISSKATGYGAVRMLKDLVPFLAISVLSAAAAMLAGSLIASPMLMLSAEIAVEHWPTYGCLRHYASPNFRKWHLTCWAVSGKNKKVYLFSQRNRPKP